MRLAAISSIQLSSLQDDTHRDRCYVMFHGYGNDPQEMVRIIQAIDPDASYLSLQGVIARPYLGGYAWYDSANDNATIQQQCSHIGNKVVQLLNCQALASKQLILIGFSQGGYLSYRICLEHSDIFHTAILLSPSFHDASTVGSHTTNTAHAATSARDMRVFVGYGEQDRQIPQPQQKAIIEALQASAQVCERRYASMRHDVCEQEFSDIRQFLGIER